MKRELMRSGESNSALPLDPRTKLLMLFMIATFVLGGAGGNRMDVFVIILTIIPFLLLLLNGEYTTALVYAVLYISGILADVYLIPITSGAVKFLTLAYSGIFRRVLPGIMMGFVALTSTTVSEFVAGMERMHITDKITIPLSVMFRFFPTVGEEFTAINRAMAMRGIKGTSAGIGKNIEYRFIPMMTCSVKIGEELSAAALTRGLGSPVRRTNICRIGFHIQDYLLIGFSCLVIAVWLIGII